MKLLKILSLCAAGLFLTTSCDLEEETFTFVAGEDVAAEGSYDQLVAGAYHTLHWPFTWGNYHNVVNFDCDYQTGPSWAFGDEGAGNFYDKGSTKNFYQYYCTTIHRANYHYYLVQKITGVTEKEKNNALGELRFLKAWSQFQLVQFFGPIPLYTYSIAEGNSTELPRSSVKEVYEHIIETLKEAEALLLPRTDEAFKKGHVCRATAKALLAKVYATIGSASMKSGQVTVKGGPGSKVNPDGTTSRLMPVAITHSKNVVAGYEEFDSQEYYRLAKEKAGEVINSGEVSLASSQKELWSPAYKNGPELLFCLQTMAGQGDDYYNYVSKDYYGWPDPAYNGEWTSGYYVQRDHWLQTFDDWDDERITWGVKHRVPYNWNKTYEKMEWYFYPERDSVKVRQGLPPYEGCPYKYETTDVVRNGAHEYGAKLEKFTAITADNNGNRTDWNWPYLRYADLILIYCEAENELNGPTTDAFAKMEMLNKRNNSTLVSKRHEKNPFTKESFRSFVLEERAKEFAAEGIRRYDLLRWGIYLQVMNAIGTVDENEIVKRREEKHLLLPFPPDVVNTNPYIDRNNPGW